MTAQGQRVVVSPEEARFLRALRRLRSGAPDLYKWVCRRLAAARTDRAVRRFNDDAAHITARIDQMVAERRGLTGRGPGARRARGGAGRR